MILFGNLSGNSPAVRVRGQVSRFLLGLITSAVVLSGQTPSKEYIRLGGRVIAIENYAPLTVGAVPTMQPAAGSGAFTITAPQATAWQATSNSGWLTLSNSSGTTSGNPSTSTVNFTVTANSGGARTADITFTGTTFTQFTVQVTQLAVSLTFDPTQFTAPSADPFDGTIIVTSNAPWTATSSDAANLTVAVGAGTLAGTASGNGGVPGGETLRYHLTNNGSPNPRTLQITFTTNPASSTTPFSVTQPGTVTLPPSQLGLDWTSATLGPEPSGGYFKVTSNAPWHAHSDAAWLTFTYHTTHTGNLPYGEQVDYSGTSNYASQARVGHLTFHFDAGDQVARDSSANPVTFTVTQNAAVLSIFPGNPTVSAGQVVEFQAYLSGSPAGAVSWSKSGGGTLSQDGSWRATYTVPTPAPSNPVTLTASLTANPQISAQTTIYFVPTPRPPTVDINPKGASGTGGQFLIQASNESGDNTQIIDLLFGTAPLDLVNGCYMQIAPLPPSFVYLADDSGNLTSIGMVGSQQVLSNSRCSVDLASSSLSWTTSAISASIKINFSGTFTGTKSVYLSGRNMDGTSPWVPLTTYTVTAPVNNSIAGTISSPDTLSPGQQFNATVIMRNSGATTWTTSGNYALGSYNPPDTTRWGVTRIAVPAQVGPGQDASFAFTATAPAAPGVYQFDWRMVHTGIWFGAVASKTISVTGPDLTITKTHSGNFTQGQIGAVYTITVRNSGTTPTSGTVSVTDALPAGLIFKSMSGTGWSCSGLTCTRSDALAGGSNYPPIAVTVDVSLTAPSSVTNTATVSGGSEPYTGNNTASDLTSITPLPTGLTLTNLTITSGTPVYQNATSVTANGGVTISGSASVTFQGGVFVRLGPEFRATAGSAGTTFRAKIQ